MQTDLTPSLSKQQEADRPEGSGSQSSGTRGPQASASIATTRRAMETQAPAPEPRIQKAWAGL